MAWELVFKRGTLREHGEHVFVVAKNPAAGLVDFTRPARILRSGISLMTVVEHEQVKLDEIDLDD